LHHWGLWVSTQPPVVESGTYLKLARKYHPVFIFDSLIRFHDGDENSATDMKRPTHAFRQLCSAGATVIVLHHRGKRGIEGGKSSPYRGSSEIAGACDLAFSVTKEKMEGGVQPLLI